MYPSVAEGFFSVVPPRLLFEAFSLAMQEIHPHLLDCNNAPKNQESVNFSSLKN